MGALRIHPGIATHSHQTSPITAHSTQQYSLITKPLQLPCCGLLVPVHTCSWCPSCAPRPRSRLGTHFLSHTLHLLAHCPSSALTQPKCAQPCMSTLALLWMVWGPFLEKGRLSPFVRLSPAALGRRFGRSKDSSRQGAERVRGSRPELSVTHTPAEASTASLCWSCRMGGGVCRCLPALVSYWEILEEQVRAGQVSGPE